MPRSYSPTNRPAGSGNEDNGERRWLADAAVDVVLSRRKGGTVTGNGEGQLLVEAAADIVCPKRWNGREGRKGRGLRVRVGVGREVRERGRLSPPAPA